MRILKYLIFILTSVAAIWYFATQKSEYQTINGRIFGTFYTVKVRAKHENRLLQRDVREELAKINDKMSVFEINSEISEINREPAGKWIELSPEMSKILKKASKIYAMSNGSFDPTTAKLIDIWGFGTTGRIQKLPDERDIKEILEVTGFNKLQFSADFKKMQKLYNGVTLNLSAIAKGYGVDKLASMLKKEGYTDFVVEIGGEVVASGSRSDKTDGWNIGIAKPTEDGNENSFIVKLKDYAVATSGDYHNYFSINGQKYSHTINPKTGYPVENNLVAVTVFHKNCMTADGLATAIMSMGEQKASEFIRSNNLAVIMFVKDDKQNITPIISEAAKKLEIQ